VTKKKLPVITGPEADEAWANKKAGQVWSYKGEYVSSYGMLTEPWIGYSGNYAGWKVKDEPGLTFNDQRENYTYHGMDPDFVKCSQERKWQGSNDGKNWCDMDNLSSTQSCRFWRQVYGNGHVVTHGALRRESQEAPDPDYVKRSQERKWKVSIDGQKWCAVDGYERASRCRYWRAEDGNGQVVFEGSNATIPVQPITGFPEPGYTKSKPNLGESAAQWLEGVAKMLREKNAVYGNSLGDPMRVFSKVDPIETILARIDDKLSRIARGKAAGEDVAKDLCGYVALAVAAGWKP
jgi:hypothetical protein